MSRIRSLPFRPLLTIMQGAASIAGIQAINFLVPLLGLPFISRALQFSQFGRYAILLSYALALTIFVDFSFHVVGPVRVRQALAERRMLSLLLESTLLKAALTIPASIVFIGIAEIYVDVEPRSIAAALLLGVTTTFTPRWAVYGMGKLFSFALISGVSKLCWLAMVVWQVRTPRDLFLLLTISVLAQLIALALSFVVIWPREHERIDPGWLRRTAGMFRQDWTQFGALLSNALTRELALVVLSAAAPITEVSLFALVDRVRILMAGFVQPVTQALFLFAIRSGSGTDLHQQRARQIANLIVLAASALAGLGVYVFARPIVFILGGAQFLGAIPVLRVLTAIPALTTLTSLLGPNTLLAAGAEKSFASSQLVAAFVALPIIVGLSYAFGAVGAAWSMVIAEMLLVYFFAQELKRHHLLGQVFGVVPEPSATRA